MKTETTGRWRNLVRNVAAASLALTCALSLTAANAAATRYDIAFTGSVPAGSLPTGGFDFDASASAPFSNFHVQWFGGDFDLTAAANSPLLTGSFSGTGFTCAETGAALSFKLLSKDPCLGSAGKHWDIFFIGGLAWFDFEMKTATGDFFFASPSVSVSSVPTACGNDATCGTGDWQIREVPVSVPEPGTAALGAIALAGYAIARRRRTPA